MIYANVMLRGDTVLSTQNRQNELPRLGRLSIKLLPSGPTRKDADIAQTGGTLMDAGSDIASVSGSTAQQPAVRWEMTYGRTMLSDQWNAMAIKAVPVQGGLLNY